MRFYELSPRQRERLATELTERARRLAPDVSEASAGSLAATALAGIERIATEQDWPEGDEHQVWLDEAPAAAIIDWAQSILKGEAAG